MLSQCVSSIVDSSHAGQRGFACVMQISRGLQKSQMHFFLWQTHTRLQLCNINTCSITEWTGSGISWLLLPSHLVTTGITPDLETESYHNGKIKQNRLFSNCTTRHLWIRTYSIFMSKRMATSSFTRTLWHQWASGKLKPWVYWKWILGSSTDIL